MNKKYYSLIETAKIISEALDCDCTDNDILYLGESCNKHFNISIHCYLRKGVLNNDGFVYYPQNPPPHIYTKNLRLLTENIGAVRKGHKNASGTSLILLLASECSPNLNNLRLGINEKNFESFTKKELCVNAVVLNKYIGLVKRWYLINTNSSVRSKRVLIFETRLKLLQDWIFRNNEIDFSSVPLSRKDVWNEAIGDPKGKDTIDKFFTAVNQEDSNLITFKKGTKK